jgi:H+/Cl- antiporter ClcA
MFGPFELLRTQRYSARQKHGNIEMKARLLRILAALLLGAALLLWLATGANRGWTKTSVPVKRTDEVTGLSVDDYQKRFVPGLDFLAFVLFATGTLAGASFLFGRNAPQPEPSAP